MGHTKSAWGGGKYHSLADGVVCTAKSKDGIARGVKHKKYPIEGVQFHPDKEAILKISLEKHRKESKGQIALTERQMRIIEHIQTNGKITTGETANMFNITRQAALKELSKLLKLEIIKLEGQGRGSYYTIA